jgi:hypothetical protein
MMTERKKSGAMLPLIIVGATLFAFGIFQSTRPPEPEVNSGFTSTPSASTPANPRTMQAPDAPPSAKNAAQRAAETGDVTAKIKADALTNTPSVLDEPWFKALRIGDSSDFRGQALAAFKDQQGKGTLNCTPVLTSMTPQQLAAVTRVSCVATDGSQMEAEFSDVDNVGRPDSLRSDGEIRATSPDNKVIKIEKNGDEFNATVETNP